MDQVTLFVDNQINGDDGDGYGGDDVMLVVAVVIMIIMLLWQVLTNRPCLPWFLRHIWFLLGVLSSLYLIYSISSIILPQKKETNRRGRGTTYNIYSRHSNKKMNFHM